MVDVGCRLPGWPFTGAAGHVAVGQYERLLGIDFVPVFEALASVHGDREILVIVAEPQPSYYAAHYDFRPGFRVTPDALREGYWRGLSYKPSGDQSGAIAYTANSIAAVGSTGTWAVWGQRDWDLVLVHAAADDGPWLHAGVPFVPPREALESFTAPNRRVTPLTDLETTTFLRNFSDPQGERNDMQ